jgi:hypothetical protein
MKKKNVWKKLLTVGLIGGSFLFQAPTCTERAQVITAGATVVTAAGVIYLVDRVIND